MITRRTVILIVTQNNLQSYLQSEHMYKYNTASNGAKREE